MRNTAALFRYMNDFGLILIGCIAGGCVAANVYGMSRDLVGSLEIQMFLGAVIGALFILLLRTAIRSTVNRSRLPEEVRCQYRALDAVAYLPLLLLVGLGAGLQFSVPIVYAVVIALTFSHGILLFRIARRIARKDAHAVTKAERDRDSNLSGGFVVLFLISGMAALIYQIVWQRVLFSAYGVNIESITIIVSLFMFGLGVGSLLGGALSRRFPNKLLHLFVACECGIGLFGFISLPLIEITARHTLDLSLWGVTLAVYALLCLPTLFMGATLPLLVTHLHARNRNIGRSVGLLYFFNTLGSAIASFVTVDLLFVFFGRQAVVGFAAVLNLSVALGALMLLRKAHVNQRTVSHPIQPSTENRGFNTLMTGSIPYGLVLVISAVTGFVSLSQEILWMRSVSYSVQGMPQVFGQVLGFFLVGIALGSLSGKRYCERLDRGQAGHPLAFIGRLFLVGALVYFFGIPFFGQIALFDKTLSLVLSYLIVGMVAYVYGSVLPVISHFGIPAGKPVGTALSRIYMANIAGSTLGSVLTGFYFMDRFTLEANILGISLVSLSISTLLFAIRNQPAGWKRRYIRVPVYLTGVTAIVMILAHNPLYGNLLGHLQHGPKFSEHAPFNHVIQNRSGIITTQPDSLGDIIYGGGAYDGRFALDPVRNSNGIRRGFMVAALHPDPAEVLEIGLSSGSWASVLMSYAKVKRLTIVEINPGYPAVIARYEDGHADVLSDPRVTIHYDDGRRWLNRNPETRFDFILMNTTFHWRSNITNLVSKEFLQLAKRHLKPDGVMYYNATGSPDVIRTAAESFRYVTQYKSFVAASDHPFDLSEREKLARFDQFYSADDRKPIFADSAAQAVAVEMATTPLPNLAPEFRARSELRVITDDNMLTEFKSIARKGIMGRLYRWRDPNLSWSRIKVRRDSILAYRDILR